MKLIYTRTQRKLGVVLPLLDHSFFVSHIHDVVNLTGLARNFLEKESKSSRVTITVPARLTSDTYKHAMKVGRSHGLSQDRLLEFLARYCACLMREVFYTHKKYRDALTTSSNVNVAKQQFISVLRNITPGHIACLEQSKDGDFAWVSFTNFARIGNITSTNISGEWFNSWNSSIVKDGRSNHALFLEPSLAKQDLYCTKKKYEIGLNHCSHAAIANACNIPEEVFDEAISQLPDDKEPIGTAAATYRIVFMRLLESRLKDIYDKPVLIREFRKILLTRNLSNFKDAIHHSTELTTDEKGQYEKIFEDVFSDTQRYKTAFGGEILGVTDVYSVMSPNINTASTEQYLAAVKIVLEAESWLRSPEIIMDSTVLSEIRHSILQGGIPSICADGLFLPRSQLIVP